MQKTVITKINTICSCGIGFDELKNNIAKEISATQIQNFEMYDLPNAQYVFTVPILSRKIFWAKKDFAH